MKSVLIKYPVYLKDFDTITTIYYCYICPQLISQQK